MDWLEILYEECDLDAFLNKLEHHHHAAFWIMDNAFNLMGASLKAKVLYDELEQSDSLFKVIESLQLKDLNRKLKDQNSLEHYSDLTGRTCFIGDCIVGNKRIAKVTCFYNESSQVEQTDFQGCLKAITIFLQMNQKVSYHNEERNNFFHNLLQMPTPSQQFIDQHIYYIPFKINLPYVIIAVTDIDSTESICGNSPYYLRILKNLFPTALFDSDEKLAISLVSLNDMSHYYHKLSKVCIENKMKLLVSIPFEDLKDTYSHYQKIKRLLQLSPTNEGVSYYKDYVLKDVLTIVHGKDHLKNFISLKVQKVFEYDTIYKTDYFETAYLLICNGYYQQEVSKILNIHINTLKYRIKQLKVLFQLDIKDCRNDEWIKLSFHIIEYLYSKEEWQKNNLNSVYHVFH